MKAFDPTDDVNAQPGAVPLVTDTERTGIDQGLGPAVHPAERRAFPVSSNLRFQPWGVGAASIGLRQMLATSLPLNRKERYYTGTVLPMIIACDDFAHLGMFLALCGLNIDPVGERSPSQDHRLLFFTEYSFTESLFTEADRARFPKPPTHADTPDVVIAGVDWLLAVEAKMFHNPTSQALNRQISDQSRIVHYLARRLSIPADRCAHVLLLSKHLRREALTAPVVTWEDVVSTYEDVAPVYWLGVLTEALNSYHDLVSRTAPYGQNADATMTGADIVTAHADGTLEFIYMGRRNGLAGDSLREDLATGRWRTQRYEVRSQPLTAANWFPISYFIAATTSA